MGHIDGTHGCPQKTVFSLSTRASVRASGWQKWVSSMVRMGAHRKRTRRSDGDTPARSQWVPSMVHMGAHKKRYFHFPPERLLERPAGRKMRIFGPPSSESGQGFG
eukprot:gene17566-biopygen17340